MKKLSDDDNRAAGGDGYTDSYNEPKGLAGRRIAEVLTDAAHDTLQFVFDDGALLTMSAEGDCCSKSWFHHVEGVDALRAGKIAAVEQANGSPRAGEEDGIEQESVETYFLRITTDRGRATVELRNESNGYYGGSIDWSLADVPGLVPLTEDY